MEYSIGVDIGGTKIHFASIDRQGRIGLRHIVPTDAQQGPESVMDKVLQGIGQILDSMDATDQVVGIGVGSAGQIHYRTGTVEFAGDTLPGWTGMSIKQRILERYGMTVHVDNDVNAIALAEKMYGAGRDCDNFICLALGTGIGGAIVEDGRLLRGAFGGAGELGHVSVDFEGPRCGCGNQGCVELYASGTGIARLGKQITEETGVRADWQPNSREIVQAWLQGNVAAARVMDIAIRALGTAVAGFIHMFNPQAVIIGGGVSDTGAVFFNALEQEVERRTSQAMRDVCRILPAYVGADAGVIGAAAQIWCYE